MKRHIILLIFSVSYFRGNTQQRFSLTQCIEYAFKQNFDVKLKELRLKQSEITLQQSQKAIYPNLRVH